MYKFVHIKINIDEEEYHQRQRSHVLILWNTLVHFLNFIIEMLDDKPRKDNREYCVC